MVDSAWFEDPLRYCNPKYHFRPLIGEKETAEDCGNFPDNIKEYIWGQQGEDEIENWKLLAKLTNGNYIYFEAWCTYSGFETAGSQGMVLFVSKDLSTILDKAMCPEEKTAYELTISKDVGLLLSKILSFGFVTNK